MVADGYTYKVQFCPLYPSFNLHPPYHHDHPFYQKYATIHLFLPPHPIGINRDWISPNQLYRHLIERADERARLTIEISNMDPGQLVTILIYHHCLVKPLPFSTIDSNYAFLSRIKTLFDFGPDGRYLQSPHLR